MNYRVCHGTSYGYSQPVSLCHNQIHLTPRTTERQRCLRSHVEIIPTPSWQAERTDFFGNSTQLFSVERPHDKLSIVARSELQLLPRRDTFPARTPPWEEVSRELHSPHNDETLAAVPFWQASVYIHISAEAREYGQASFYPGRPILEASLDLTGRIFRDFKYDQNATGVFTKPAEVFRSRRGVCQDFAHLQLSCFRSLGLAARYVSGYLVTSPPPGTPRLVGADASHAWVSVFCGSAGWIDLDPTNNVLPDMRHITLAWGRDYADVCPIQGVLIGGGQSSLSVAVDVSLMNDRDDVVN